MNEIRAGGMGNDLASFGKDAVKHVVEAVYAKHGAGSAANPARSTLPVMEQIRGFNQMPHRPWVGLILGATELQVENLELPILQAWDYVANRGVFGE